MLRFVAFCIALLLGATAALADAGQDCQKLTGDAAIKACDLAIRQNPRNAAAFSNRGMAYHSKGDLDRAFADYNKAIELDPKLVAAYNNRGNVHRSRNDLDRALADYNKAIQLNPKLANAYNGRGNAYGDRGDYDRALADYNKAIELDPKFALAYSNRGNVHRSRNDLDRALADYNKAIQLNPKLANAYNGRGNAYGDRGDYDRALADYNKAIELDPKLADAYVNRGRIYGKKRDLDRAFADYTRAIEIDPKLAEAYATRGGAYRGKGDLDRAIADHTKAIELDPKYAWAYADRGAAYRDKGDPDRALADYTRAIELEPKYAWAYASRGVAYRDKGDLDRALADYTKAIEVDPRQGAAYHNRGLIYFTQKDYGRAVADFTKAIEIDPKDGRAVLRRAFAHHDSGDLDKALLDYASALLLVSGQDKGRAHLNRLTVFERLKREGEGFDDLMALAKAHPDVLSRFSYWRVATLVRKLNEAMREAEALQLLEALASAGYRGDDALQIGDGLKPLLIEQHVRLGRLDEAAALIPDLNGYGNLLTLRVDRRYEALWSRPAIPGLLQPQDFPGRDLAHAQKVAARNPRSIKALNRLLEALRLSARHTEAVTLARAALVDPTAYEKSPEDEAWLRNRLADLLVAQGNFDEAVETLRPLLARDARQERFLVSQFINLGSALYQQGRFQEAIDTAQKAHGLSSPYGEMWIQSVSVCALPKLGRAADAEAVLLDMQRTPTVNHRAVLRGLLCLGREDEAAAFVIANLQADDSRVQTLTDLQDCRENPRRPQFARELRALLVKVRDRPEVRKAVDSAGVLVAEPVACGDRYGTS